MNPPRFLILIPGSILDEDGGYVSADTEEELQRRVQDWKNLNFSEVVVYEKR